MIFKEVDAFKEKLQNEDNKTAIKIAKGLTDSKKDSKIKVYNLNQVFFIKLLQSYFRMLQSRP